MFRVQRDRFCKLTMSIREGLVGPSSGIRACPLGTRVRAIIISSALGPLEGGITGGDPGGVLG